MIVLGVVLGVGGIAAGQAVTGAILLISLAGSGWFMIWLAKGWDKPLDDSAELYKYGRPANAEVLSIEDSSLSADGTRTAKLSLKVSPVNESSFKSTRLVALPGGVEPGVGATVTVKFDPNSRKNFVLLEGGYQVASGVGFGA
jgi:hypothetical protein